MWALPLGDTTVAIVESEMSLHAGQEKKLLRGQMIIAKVTLERAHAVWRKNDVILSLPYIVRRTQKK